MISKTAMTYGGALYDLAREESLEEQILGELHAVSDLFRQNPDYTKLLMEPSIEKQERAKLIDEAWGGSVHPYTQNFMKLLCDNGTISALPDCFEAFRGRYNRDHDIIDVCAVSAVPLTIDPKAQGVRYQMNRSIRALQNGGITGQGLYHGSMIQSNSLPEQHNDLIFSSIGEELGLLGCLAVLILLTAIIIRIIHVGIRSGNNMNRLICVGIAGMLASQTIINVGVCLGIFPVVGLTLPFFSYGGSSIVTMFLAMGIVSGIHMRPAPDISAMYIRPKLN